MEAPDSTLLTVNGWGHTSLFMSTCADAAIERYLIDIATPPPGTTCDQDIAPFGAANGRIGPLTIISTTDRDAFDAQLNATSKRLQQ